MSAAAGLVYRQCGLRVRSELDLHLPARSGDTFDIDVRWGPEIHNTGEPLPGDEHRRLRVGRRLAGTPPPSNDSGYQLRFHDCGQFMISADLAEVQVWPDPAGSNRAAPDPHGRHRERLSVGLRGNTVLHASAVAIDGKALAFVGQSGRGKSTLAALMCLDGAQLVTDDVLTVAGDETVICRGGASELRLRQAAADLARSHPDAATRTTADDRLALSADQPSLDPLPLACIVIPAPDRTATAVEVRTSYPRARHCSLCSPFLASTGWTDATCADPRLLRAEHPRQPGPRL